MRLAAFGVCALTLVVAAGAFSARAQAAPPPTPVPVTNRPAATPVPQQPQAVRTPTPAPRPPGVLASPTPPRQVQQTLPQPTFTPRIVYATVTPVPARPAANAPSTANTNPQWRPADGPPPAPAGPAAATPVALAPVPTRTTRPGTPVVTKQTTQPLISGKAPLSFTPTGNAGGGGQAPVKQKVNEALMYFGILSLAGAGSWGVYYLVRPPKD